MFLDRFDVLISKIIFLKIKNHHFDIFLNENILNRNHNFKQMLNQPLLATT
jgi:hypothetical protein